MATQISLEAVLGSGPPPELGAVFVDTNIVIRYENPFGFINAAQNYRIVHSVNQLKSRYPVHAATITAVEYYKYMQVGYYNIFIQTQPGNFRKYSTALFKKMRTHHAAFAEGWQLRLKSFRKTFAKHFPPPPGNGPSGYSASLLGEFSGKNIDFGDHLLIAAARQVPASAILTTDKDFLSTAAPIGVIHM